jgi:hypothetical protein
MLPIVANGGLNRCHWISPHNLNVTGNLSNAIGNVLHACNYTLPWRRCRSIDIQALNPECEPGFGFSVLQDGLRDVISVSDALLVGVAGAHGIAAIIEDQGTLVFEKMHSVSVHFMVELDDTAPKEEPAQRESPNDRHGSDRNKPRRPVYRITRARPLFE